MADIEKLITQLDEALKDERTAENLRRVARILGGDQVQQVDVKVSYDDLIKRLASLETDVGILMATDASKSRSIGDLRGLVNGLEQRIEQLEDAAGWTEGANMENATEPSIRDDAVSPDVAPDITYEWKSSFVVRPTQYLQIEVLTANNKRDFFFSPDDIDFSPTAFDPVIAWRYSRET